MVRARLVKRVQFTIYAKIAQGSCTIYMLHTLHTVYIMAGRSSLELPPPMYSTTPPSPQKYNTNYFFEGCK